MRRLLPLVALVALVAAACNPAEIRLLRGPMIVDVDAPGPDILADINPELTEEYPAVFNAFLPNELSVYPGESILFRVRFTGEPHTVTFGRLVDAAVAKVRALGVKADTAKVEALSEMKALPTLLPGAFTTEPREMTRSAAEPCFLRTGVPPRSANGEAPPCDDTSQPEFDGEQAFFNSGWMDAGRVFRMTLSRDIEPGRYAFMCLVHRREMTGSVKVVERGEKRSVLTTVRDDREDQLRQIRQILTTAAHQAVRATSSTPMAGLTTRDSPNAFLATFVPAVIKARAGEPITWTITGGHTISFNAPGSAEGLLRSTREGRVEFNDEALVAASGHAKPKTVVASNGVKTLVVDGGEWDGRGSISSGYLRPVSPAAMTYKLRITEPGTYEYKCLVHGERGKVRIS